MYLNVTKATSVQKCPSILLFLRVHFLDVSLIIHDCTSIKKFLNYKVGITVIKSTKTGVVVMETNARRHP